MICLVISLSSLYSFFLCLKFSHIVCRITVLKFKSNPREGPVCSLNSKRESKEAYPSVTMLREIYRFNEINVHMDCINTKAEFLLPQKFCFS